MVAYDVAEKAMEEAYERGVIKGKIAAYKEMSEAIEFYTRALITALDAQIEELQEKQQ